MASYTLLRISNRPSTVWKMLSCDSGMSRRRSTAARSTSRLEGPNYRMKGTLVWVSGATR